MKMKDIREKQEAELISLEEELRRDLFELLNEKRINRSLEKPHLIRQTRRSIAKIKTFLNEKKTTSEGGK